MMPSRNAKLRSGFIYGAGMAVSSAYCVIKLGSPELFGLLAAGCSVLAAGALGYLLGPWYLPVGGEGPSFEYFACPLLVSVFAPFLGLAGMLLGLFFVNGEVQVSEFAKAWIPVTAMGTVVFWLSTWPVSAASFGAAGVLAPRYVRMEGAGE